MNQFCIILFSLLNFLNPFNKFTSNINSISKKTTSQIVAMTPPGPIGSKASRITDAMNDEGCSSNIQRKRMADGSVKITETLICTKRIIEKPSGEKKQKPNSKQMKEAKKEADIFFKDLDESTK